jgi:Ankyrin repeats (3 copies)
MAEGFSDYKFPGVSQTPQIAIPPTIGEEKAEAGPQLSFAERVVALNEHDRKKIDRYLSGKDLKILSSSKQRKILWKAIFYKDVDAVKVLLECGVDVNRCNRRGVTPLYEACEPCHVDLVKTLLLKGADPNIPSADEGRLAPLHILVAHDHYVEKKQNNLACAELLLNHGADVNQKIFGFGSTPLHLVGPYKQPELLALLLSRGADPLLKNTAGKRPKLRPEDLKRLQALLTEALRQGKRSQVDRWIRAIGKLLPDPKAASLLVEWAPLCSAHAALAKRIHTIIADYLKKLPGDPPADVAAYVKAYNVGHELDRILGKLAKDDLKPVGTVRDFRIEGASYSVEKHGDTLIRLARYWANHDEDHMNRVIGILNFAQTSAKEQNAPSETRKALFAAVKRLRNELQKNPDAQIAKRAETIDDFLNPFNGPQ